MSYDLVEFATAVKPLLLQRLLEDAEQAVYLDPDTYLTAPLVELPGALEASAGGILLTPHFLGPPPAGADHSDGHLLLVGVNNLGFCAVDRRSLAALDWWWSHLSTECLYDPLAGLFVDQKWMDIGSSHFEAASFRHAGYNVERRQPVGAAAPARRGRVPDRLDRRAAPALPLPRLRLERAGEAVAARPGLLRAPGPGRQRAAAAVQGVCRRPVVLRGELPPAPPYPYATDTRGRTISRQLRRAYGRERQRSAVPLPSPFEASEASAYERWRRRAWLAIGRGLVKRGPSACGSSCPRSTTTSRSAFHGWPGSSTTASPAGAAAGVEQERVAGRDVGRPA